MRYLIMVMLFSACTNKDQPKKSVKKYCVHNGYSGFSPKCADLKWATSGFIGVDCEVGNWHGDLINPTNVSECEDVP